MPLTPTEVLVRQAKGALLVREDERAFQRTVTELAELLGWEWMWVRPMLTKLGGYRTGTSGTMAKGWPDVTLLRARDKRLIFVEFKRDGEKTTDDQDRVLGLLSGVADVRVWRPADWDEIVATLR